MFLMKKVRLLLPVTLILPSLFLAGCGGSSSSSGTSDSSDTDDGVTTPVSGPATAAEMSLGLGLKTFEFTWTDVSDATYYKLLENPDNVSGFVQVGSDIASGVEEYEHTVALYNRINASYILQSCNDSGCTDSDATHITGTLDDAIGYVAPIYVQDDDNFGYSIALSDDGSILAVGATGNNSSVSGNTCAYGSSSSNSGAVYVFRKQDGNWAQEACVKPTNTGADDYFGYSVALDADGETLVVGAIYEDGSTTGINSTPNNGSSNAGAVYVFNYNGDSLLGEDAGLWVQGAYIKASNTDAGDYFGESVALSADGATLAVGAKYEDSSTTGVSVSGSFDDDAGSSGAAYVFRFAGDAWAEEAYIKSSNTGADDRFGISISLNADGSVLAVGAYKEDSSATGINSVSNDDASNAGASYVFRYANDVWAEEAYVKASNASSSSSFGWSVALSADGSALAVGASDESGSATYSGATYVYRYANAAWTEEAYIKASAPVAGDYFGRSVSLNTDGTSLAIGASGEDSLSTGVGSTSDSNGSGAGAAYVFNFDGSAWEEEAYIKASNAGAGDSFGTTVALSNDGEVLAVGAYEEDGIDSEEVSASNTGAVYLY
jgi:hypothetical protein